MADEATPSALDLPGLRVVADTRELPPSRYAAFLDLPGAKGSGQLVHRPPQWLGDLHVSFASVAVDGLAIIGDDSLDLLILLAASFTPPIQLSFGFTLSKVGGIVGISRRPNAARLSELVENGQLARLLFPRDPATEAEQLLPLLDSCFEHRRGSFTIGPMLELGWGTPTMLTATVGVLVSDDAVTIVGRLVVDLPRDPIGLVHLEALVLGRVDADGIAIDASLVNSHIGPIPIAGDIRLRIKTSGSGSFAFSAGGFHPAFPAPQGMAGMRRITTSISPGPLVTLRLEAYVAITTNSAQFGARVDVSAAIAGFGIHGNASFDALFLFDPFRFETRFEAMVSIEVGGVDVLGVGLSASLSGPAPWRFRGHASVTIIVTVPVDIPELVWGPNTSEFLPPARDPVKLLADEIGRMENWAASSLDVPALARLAPTIDAGQIAVHPMSELGFRQRVVPIETEIRRMDGVVLSDPTRLSVRVAGAPGPLGAVGAEAFVRQQFQSLDDNDRLSGAGFQAWPGGFDLEPGGARIGAVVPKPEGYELLVIESGGTVHSSKDAVTGTAAVGHGVSAGLVAKVQMVTFRPRAGVAPR